MDAIKKQTEDIQKTALQMTGLVTLMSAGGSTPQKMNSLNKLYNQVEQCSKNIMTEVHKIVEYNDAKQRSLRKDLAMSKKRIHSLQEDLDQSRTDAKKLRSEISFIMDDSLEDNEDESLPLTSTPLNTTNETQSTDDTSAEEKATAGSSAGHGKVDPSTIDTSAEEKATAGSSAGHGKVDSSRAKKNCGKKTNPQ